MLLFKKRLADLILLGLKTETRRVWKKRRALVGSTHGCYTRPPFVKDPGQPFARVLILAAYPEALGAITTDGANREGFQDRDQFLAGWREIHGKFDLRHRVWVVRFELVEDLT